MRDMLVACMHAEPLNTANSSLISVFKLPNLIKPNVRKIVMRLGTGGETLGFWLSQTTHGVSMGPIVPGEEHVHLTFFMNGGVVNAHLKIIENGKPQYKNLTVMSPYQFQQRLRQTATNMLNSLGPIDPDQDAILVSDQGHKLFKKLAGGSLTMAHKGRTGYIDFDFGIIVDEIQSVAENPMEYFTLGKAYNLVGSDRLKFGLTEEGAPIFPVNDQIYSWGTTSCEPSKNMQQSQELDDSFNFLSQTSWGKSIYDITSIIGVPQLFSEIEKRKLFQKWFDTRPQLKSAFLNQEYDNKRGKQ